MVTQPDRYNDFIILFILLGIPKLRMFVFNASGTVFTNAFGFRMLMKHIDFKILMLHSQFFSPEAWAAKSYYYGDQSQLSNLLLWTNKRIKFSSYLTNPMVWLANFDLCVFEGTGLGAGVCIWSWQWYFEGPSSLEFYLHHKLKFACTERQTNACHKHKPCHDLPVVIAVFPINTKYRRCSMSILR